MHFNMKESWELLWDKAFAATTYREQIEKKYPFSTCFRGEGREFRAEAMAKENMAWDKACFETEKFLKNETNSN